MFEALVGLSPIVGMFVSWFVFYQRSGLARIKAEHRIDWREFLLPNLGWFLMMWGKCIVWPGVLVLWLVQGRPESRWQAVIEKAGRPSRAILRVSSAEQKS